MFPWGHAAVGYLLYTLVQRTESDSSPEGRHVVALAFGTQFPDLIDKSIGWYIDVALVPSGRSLAHSLLVATLLVLSVQTVATRFDRRELGFAFSVGYLSHLASDALYPVLFGNWSEFSFLAWPLLEQPNETGTYAILEMLLTGIRTPTGLFELALFGLATALWLHHNKPGLDELHHGAIAIANLVSR